ncbi:MAG: beta-ketoacyl synthase N-terminal-like domain-containing protein [Butyricicoccaceae bacterium]
MVITGMGAVTPVGIGVSEYWNALKEGTCGVGKITRFDAAEMPVQIAAELKDFDPTAYMPKTLARTMDPFMQFAFIAAEQAIADSGLCIESESDRVGIVMGTAMDGVTTVAQTQAAFDEGKRVGPRFVPMTIGNIAAAQIAIAHGIHGPSLTLNTACSAGGDAIMTATMLLHSGEADAVLRRWRREHPLPYRCVRSRAGQGAFAPQRRSRARLPSVRCGPRRLCHR